MEINPGHPTTDGLRGHWHKALAVVLHKYRHLLPSTVSITPADLREFEEAWAEVGGGCIVADDTDNRLTFRLVSEGEARELARKQAERG